MAEAIDRTVVFIGRTGAGKSACANTLIGKLSMSIQESDESVSVTKYVDSCTAMVDWKEKQYRLKVVDTIGIGDTDLGHDEVLKRLAQACYECREGINAVFFVTGGRFTVEEADAWDIMWKVLFNPAVIDYVTIVRSKFTQFMNPSAVQTDCAKLKAQKGAAGRIMPNVKKIVHVDNPPSQYLEWKGTRQKSHGVLMDRISQCSSIYKPPQLEEVNERISNTVEEKRVSDDAVASLLMEVEKATEKIQTEMHKQIAEERERAAQAELRLVREMNQLLRERVKMQESGGDSDHDEEGAEFERGLGDIGSGAGRVLGRWLDGTVRASRCSVM